MDKKHFLKKFFQDIPTEKKKQKKPPKKIVEETEPAVPKSSKEKKEDRPFEKFFEKNKSLSEELDNKLDALLKGHDLSRERISSYLDNPNNFSQVEWGIIKSRREELKLKLTEAIGEKELEEKEEKTQKKTLKKRKGKALGAKKRWLKMD